MTNSDVIGAFAETARKYCTWIEEPLGDEAEAMGEIRELLAELNLAAVRLQAADDGASEDVDGEEVTKEQWEEIRAKYANLPVNGYWEMANPLNYEETDPVFGVLEDDLADIYSDVKRALNLYDDGFAADAASDWKFSYRTHWGEHLLVASRVLHEYFGEREV